jgi:outer membrane protein assembly factor BamD (BamD/ComL family)
MKQFIPLTLMILSLAGCATFKDMQSSLAGSYEANRKLSSARQALEQGKSATAISILEGIVTEPAVKGVTDEALFRLSVLKLDYEDKDGTLPSLRHLERLRYEYPESSWVQYAKPLIELLKGASEIKKQNRNLKILNISLTKDNKEMRQSIERLKNLDMQLERKIQ